MSQEREKTEKFLKTGDKQAFEWLFLKYENYFKRYAEILTGGRYPEDLIQLTCLQVLQYDGRHKDPDAFFFKNFFGRSLHNTFINLYRTKRITFELLEYQDIPAGPEYTELDLDPLIRYIEELLTPDQKRVMYYRMQGLKFREIAKEMQISSNTATGLFRYGRMRLHPYKKAILK